MKCCRSALLLLLSLSLSVAALADEPALTHGPILGRPGPESMRVWIRTSEPRPFRILASRDTDFSEGVISAEGETTASADNTGYADLSGLKPARFYYYAVELGGQLVETYADIKGFPRLKTWQSRRSFAHPEANPDGVANRLVGIAVCNHFTGTRKSPVFANLRQRWGKRLDLFIHNGDYLYDRLRHRSTPTEMTFDDCRLDYRSQLELLPDMAAFFRETPQLFQFDDHELGPEQATAEIGWKPDQKTRRHKTNPLLRDIGITPWSEYCGWANFDMPHYQAVRYGRADLQSGESILVDKGASFLSLDEKKTSTLHLHLSSKNAGVYKVAEVIDNHRLRIRPAAIQTEDAASYSIGTRHYHDFRMGSAHFFVLDARSERSLYEYEKRDDPDQTVLGASQVAWLTEGVAKSDAEFIIIVSPVPWTIWHNASHVAGKVILPKDSPKEDGLIGALREREPLLDLFDKLKKPVAILSGDLHSGYGVQITDNVWEFMISPIGSRLHPVESGGNPPLQGRFDSGGREVKIKWASTYRMRHVEAWESQKRRHGFVYGLLHVNECFPSGIDKEGHTIWQAYDTPTLRVEVRDTESDEVVYAETLSSLDAE